MLLEYYRKDCVSKLGGWKYIGVYIYFIVQTKNTEDDNAKQLAVAIDKHYQEWADLAIKATKEGTQLPEHPNYAQITMMAKQILQGE